MIISTLLAAADGGGAVVQRNQICYKSRMLMRGYRYRLFPTAEQEAVLSHFSGVCRLIYNLALEQRRDFWRQFSRATGKRLNYITQGHQLTDLRREFDWIADVPASCQTQALRDLERAYAAFFKGVSAYPTPRRKGVNDSFRIKGELFSARKLNAKWAALKSPKLGEVKFRITRPYMGRVCNATICRDALGWFVSLVCERGDIGKPADVSTAVGIDRGVANTIALSDGRLMSAPSSLGTIDLRVRQAQRILARRKKGSQRRLRQLRRFARLSAKRARIRRDWHHKMTTSICREFGVVVIEDLKIGNMTASAKGTVAEPGVNVRQKAGLNRSILNQGWYALETMLAYKLQERGGHLVKVDPAYTSQTCSECGTIDKKSRESQARFSCQHCGFAAHADTNAAINILRRNTAWLRAEGITTPDETRTGLSREVHENHPALVA